MVTVAEQALKMKEQVPAIPEENYLLEPQPRGTASVVALAAAVLKKRDPQAAMAILTADHFIREKGLFHSLIRTAFQVAENDYLVTMGIHPTSASTGYGYIEQGDPLEEEYPYPVYFVKRFREKADPVTGEQMLRDGRHSWNSGMFVWKADTILAEQVDGAERIGSAGGRWLHEPPRTHGLKGLHDLDCDNLNSRSSPGNLTGMCPVAKWWFTGIRSLAAAPLASCLRQEGHVSPIQPSPAGGRPILPRRRP